MALDNADIARSYIDKFNEHDADACSALMAEDGKFFDMVSGREFEGPAGLREWNQLVFGSFPDASIEPLNPIVVGDTVVGEAVFRGTQRGALVTPVGSIPPTGRQVELQLCVISRYRDGKIVSARQYYDGLAMLRQLGVAPGVAETAEARPQAEPST